MCGTFFETQYTTLCYKVYEVYHKQKTSTTLDEVTFSSMVTKQHNYTDNLCIQASQGARAKSIKYTTNTSSTGWAKNINPY